MGCLLVNATYILPFSTAEGQIFHKEGERGERGGGNWTMTFDRLTQNGNTKEQGNVGDEQLQYGSIPTCFCRDIHTHIHSFLYTLVLTICIIFYTTSSAASRTYEIWLCIFSIIVEHAGADCSQRDMTSATSAVLGVPHTRNTVYRPPSLEYGALLIHIWQPTVKAEEPC